MTTRHLLGDYEAAIETGQGAVSSIEKLEEPGTLVGPVYDGLALLYHKLGDFERSRYFLEHAYREAVAEGREWRATQIIADIATIERLEGNPERALELHLQSLAYFEARKEQHRTRRFLQEIARDYEALGQLDKSIEYIDRARALETSAPAFSFFTSLEADRARYLRKSGRLEEAESLLRKHWEKRDQLTLAARIDFGVELVRTLAARGETSEAIVVGTEVTDVVHDFGATLEVRRMGPLWAARTHEVFKEIAGIHLDSYWRNEDVLAAKQAFNTLEAGTSWALHRQASAGLNDLSEEERVLERELIALSNQRADAEAGSERFQRLTSEYYQVLSQLEALRLEGDISVYQPAQLSDVQARLAPGELVLRFACFSSESCVRFDVSRGDFAVHGIESPELPDRISAVDSNVRLRASVKEDMRWLSDRLIGGIDFSTIESMTIMAEYPVNRVPFHALPVGDSTGALIGQVALTSVPSLTPRLSERRSEFEYDVTVLADPAFSMASYGPESKEFETWTQGLKRLPWTAREATSMLELADQGRANVFVGDQATASNLLSPATLNSRVVHIASHAYFDAAKPDLVGIAVTPEPGHTGFVTFETLLSHRTQAELVVISGCETGLGHYLAGEGEVSLAKGFHAMGAENVLSTRWRVGDKPTAEFMSHFHRELQTHSIDVALQNAILRMKRNPRYRHPYFWAGYQLSSFR